MASAAVDSGLACVRGASESDVAKIVFARINVLKSRHKIDAFHGVDRKSPAVHWVVHKTAKADAIARKRGVKYITLRIDATAFPSDAYMILLVLPKLRRVFEVRRFSNSDGTVVLQVFREHDLAPRKKPAKTAIVNTGQPLIVETLRRAAED